MTGNPVTAMERATVGMRVVKPLPTSIQKLHDVCCTYEGSSEAYWAKIMDQYLSDSAWEREMSSNKHNGDGNTCARATSISFGAVSRRVSRASRARLFSLSLSSRARFLAPCRQTF